MIINEPLLPIPSKFSFRRATNNDCEQIKKIVFKALEEYGLIPEPNIADNDLFDVETHYKAGYFGLIEKDNIPVATFGLSEIAPETVEIRKMYSKSNVRGNGLGKWMVAYLLQIAQDNKYKIVELETESSMIEAIGLYKKFGFVEKQFENKTPRCDKAFHLYI